MPVVRRKRKAAVKKAKEPVTEPKVSKADSRKRLFEKVGLLCDVIDTIPKADRCHVRSIISELYEY